MYHDGMQRTTIMAEEHTLARLREIAHQEGRSLAEVIREALEERARRPAPRLQFLGIGESAAGTGPTARESGDRSWIRPQWR